MRKVLIALGVIVIVLVVADRITKVVAESQAEARIQEAYGLGDRPDVTVRGFPFLTQLVSRNLNHVDLAVDNAGVGRLDRLDVDITARDIEIIDRTRGRAAVVAGSLTLPYDSVVGAAQGAGAPVTSLAYGGEPGTVAMTARVDLPTGEVDVVAHSTVRFDGSRISVRLSSLEVDGRSAPSGLDLAVGDLLDFDIDLPQIPAVGQITVDAVEAGPDGIVATVTGRDVAVG